MRFGSPDNLWLLTLLPVLVVVALWAAAARCRDLSRFAGTVMKARLTQDVSTARQYWKQGLVVVGIAFLVGALVRPQFGTRLEMAERRGVDVVVCLDVSRSMLAEDVRPNRLERARHQVGELLRGLQGDRVGLVLFAGKAFVQCPLTLDHGALHMLLAGADAGTFPVQGTALAHAIRVARSCFEAGDRQDRVIVLFTDGEEHVGSALAEAEASAIDGIRIYAVGLGTPDGDLIPVHRADCLEYHRDAHGNYVRTRLAERSLKEVALAANGAYYRTTVAGGEIRHIGKAIGTMEQKQLGGERATRYEERYRIPLFMAIVCFAAEAMLTDRVRRRGEWRGRFA